MKQDFQMHDISNVLWSKGLIRKLKKVWTILTLKMFITTVALGHRR